MSNILVTGGAGFIGSNIAEKLIHLKHRIVILDDLSTGKRENLASFIDNPLCRFVEGTILDVKILENLLREEGIEYILHQAARPSVAKSVADPLKTNEINVNGTLNVLQAALEGGVKRVVVASSSSIYGDTPELPKRESMPHNPQSPYAITKVIKELYLKNFYRIYGLSTVGLRYFNVYGKRQDPHSDYAAVIPKFITQALKNENLTIEDDGLQTRDFTYIEDVVAANILATKTEKETGGMCFNVACGERTSIQSLAEKIIKLTDSQSKITYRERRPGDIKNSLADVSLAGKYLGYRPGYNLNRGLKKVIPWYIKELKKHDCRINT